MQMKRMCNTHSVQSSWYEKEPGVLTKITPGQKLSCGQEGFVLDSH